MSDPLAAEASLLEALRDAQGDVDRALKVLLGRLLPIVRLWCIGRLRDPGLRDFADDIVQETAIRVVRHLGTCRASSASELAAWTLTIAHRESLREIEKGWLRHWFSLEAVGMSGGQAEVTRVVGPVRNELSPLLERAHAELPKDTQRLLYIPIIDGRT